MEKKKSKIIKLRGKKYGIFSNSYVDLYDTSHAELRDASYAKLYDASHAVLYDTSNARLHSTSYADLCNNSHAVLWGSSHAVLHNASNAELRMNSHAILQDASHAVLWDSSNAVLMNNSRAILHGNSNAELRGTSQAVACETSHVVLHDESFVELRDFAVAHIMSEKATYKKGKYATVINVCYPSSIQDWVEMKNIPIVNGRIELWKCVRLDGTDFFTNTLKYLEYITTAPDWDKDYDGECGKGLHLSDSEWGAKIFIPESHMGNYLLIKVSAELSDCVPFGGMPTYPMKIRARECRFVSIVERVENGKVVRYDTEQGGVL